jgi:hypothetical protein
VEVALGEKRATLNGSMTARYKMTLAFDYHDRPETPVIDDLR